MNDNSITRIYENSFWYHKYTEDVTKIEINKYQLSYFNSTFYPDFHYFFCNCVSFYKSFICKHIVKLSELYNLKLMGYNEVKVFATNAKRGPKPKKKSKKNC